MLDIMRERSQGLAAKVVLGFIILTFGLTGIGGYLGRSTEPTAAVVNGEEITKAAYEQAYRNERSRMERQFGQMFEQLAADEGYMRTLRSGVLDRLINEQLQTQFAEQVGLRVSDSQLKQLIREMPEFQVDGKFDNSRYNQLLSTSGYQPNTFRDLVRTQTTRQQLARAVATTDFALPSEIKTHNALDKQTRDIEYVVIKKGDYFDKVTLTDDDKQAYYDQNKNSYATTEQVALQYIELKVSDLIKDIAVSDAEAETYYNENINRFKLNKERRRAAHILFEFGDDESAAKAKADDVLAQLKQGADFVEMVKTHSQDTLSAENDGDLDFFERGVFGDSFDDAVFAIQTVGELTDVVKSDSAYHIIKVTGVEAEKSRAFEEVKTEIADTIKRDQAIGIINDRHNDIANLAYEISDRLDDAAGAANVSIKETALFSRFAAPAAVNFKPVLDAAFSEPVLGKKLNSEVIEINDEHVMVVRVLKHEPSRIQALSEVEDKVTKALTQQKAAELAKTTSDELLATLTLTGKLADDESIKAKTLEVKSQAELERVTSSVDNNIRTQAFKLAHPQEGKLSASVVAMANGDYAIVAVSKVTEGKQPDDTKATEQQLAGQYSRQSYASFIESLKATAEIKTTITDVQ